MHLIPFNISHFAIATSSEQLGLRVISYLGTFSDAV